MKWRLSLVEKICQFFINTNIGTVETPLATLFALVSLSKTDDIMGLANNQTPRKKRCNSLPTPLECNGDEPVEYLVKFARRYSEVVHIHLASYNSAVCSNLCGMDGCRYGYVRSPLSTEPHQDTAGEGTPEGRENPPTSARCRISS